MLILPDLQSGAWRGGHTTMSGGKLRLVKWMTGWMDGWVNGWMEG